MKNKTATILSVIIFYSTIITAQVQVSKEPLHKKVLENKYIRLLDVWLQPGDTTLFHIHSTPSLFLQFTNTYIQTQLKGQGWIKEETVAGNVSYLSFDPDVRVHRVTNCDTVPFHVIDLEILSAYKPTEKIKPLPFTMLFENEKAVAYRLTSSSFNKQIISDRGPMIAELVAGDRVILNNAKGKKQSEIKTGKYLYIEPGSSFYFSAIGNEEINLVLFEIK